MIYGSLINYKEEYHSKENGKTSNTISFLEENVNLNIKELYTVRAGDRLDLIASDKYNDSSLWWIIAFANKIDDPIFDLKPGQKILIPTVKSNGK